MPTTTALAVTEGSMNSLMENVQPSQSMEQHNGIYSLLLKILTARLLCACYRGKVKDKVLGGAISESRNSSTLWVDD